MTRHTTFTNMINNKNKIKTNLFNIKMISMSVNSTFSFVIVAKLADLFKLFETEGFLSSIILVLCLISRGLGDNDTLVFTGQNDNDDEDSVLS